MITLYQIKHFMVKTVRELARKIALAATKDVKVNFSSLLIQ